LPETETRLSYWKRLLAGCALVLVASTAATAAFGVDEYNEIVNALIEGEKLELGQELAKAEEGDPQTILLLGSDTIGKKETEIGRQDPRSDTIILARLDPKREATALMSLPRDLRVEIPGHGTDKINAAYSLGGPKLTLETVKKLTGIPINHVITVDLNGFVEVVDRLGCVYVDVDRRYYNVDATFSPIDLQPGYQKLCGLQALAYARFRKEDTDIVRGARQQDFLRAFKQQTGVEELFQRQAELIEIFRENTASSIATKESATRLLRLALASATQPIQEIHFQGEVGASYVTASDEQVEQLTADFLGGKPSKGPRGKLRPEDTPEATATGERGRGGKKTPAEQKQAALEDATTEGQQQAEQAQAAGADFSVYYPTTRTQGSLFTGEPRVYKIGVGARGSANRARYSSYRMVLKKSGVGEYYGIQGTTWKEPPILDDPSETRTIDGRKFDLYFDGDRLRLVAWRTPKGVYWVSNTLLQSLSVREMLQIASSTRAL
jgi:LCP family protein required for cell wall assembly